jgi:GNAT superfamily N-acetyltransferase
MPHNLLHDDQLNISALTVDETMSRAMALNLAAWHDSSVKPFGLQTFWTGSLWWRQRGNAPIYLAAIVVDGQTPNDALFSDLRTVQDAWAATTIDLYECWGRRDLSGIGFEQRWKNPWYLRPAASIAESTLPDGLSIETVTTADQLAEFERASWEGFEEPEEEPDVAFRDRQPFSWHARATLDDPGMYYLVARLDGQVVASTIAYVTDDMVGIYGLSTLPRFRRRGYATALVRASVALRPDLPVSVYPDPETVPIYTGMGFVRGGDIAVWQKKG